MSILIFILKKDPIMHKIRYSKTLKGDSAGALLGLIVGLFVGYLSLSSVGSVSVNLMDLTLVLHWLLFLSLVYTSAIRLRLSRVFVWFTAIIIPLLEWLYYRLFMLPSPYTIRDPIFDIGEDDEDLTLRIDFAKQNARLNGDYRSNW